VAPFDQGLLWLIHFLLQHVKRSGGVAASLLEANCETVTGVCNLAGQLEDEGKTELR
jgi:hypothetical protein